MTVELASFFFGNKIPRDTALELIEEYSNPSLRNIELFCEKYETWQLQTGSDHMSSYYNMSIGRMVYINESAHDQLELVGADPNNIKIGFGNFFPDFFRKRIENKRSAQ